MSPIPVSFTVSVIPSSLHLIRMHPPDGFENLIEFEIRLSTFLDGHLISLNDTAFRHLNMSFDMRLPEDIRLIQELTGWSLKTTSSHSGI